MKETTKSATSTNVREPKTPQDRDKSLLHRVPDQYWDDICRCNGFCCRIAPGIACPSLDTETRLCKVYDKRDETETCTRLTPETVPEMHQRGVLPDECGYVRMYHGEDPGPGPKSPDLIPFEAADAGTQVRYLLRRREWFDK
jgi:uncharacterized cysteine cluster protein YcgN (CxxCxxCC family)